MTTPDLLTRCRAVLARLHYSPVLPGTSVDDDVIEELEIRGLAVREPYGRHSNIYATPLGVPYCADPSTFTLPEAPSETAGLTPVGLQVWLLSGAAEPEPRLDAGWPFGADRGVRP